MEIYKLNYWKICTVFTFLTISTLHKNVYIRAAIEIRALFPLT